MFRQRIAIGIVVLVLFAACGEKASRALTGGGGTPRFESTWVSVNDSSDQFVLSKFGEGFALERGGTKFPAVYERGKLVISTNSGTMIALYDRASDRIMLSGGEYRRGTEADRGMGQLKRTLADMRTIATAWEARATDTNSYTVDEYGELVSAERLERVLSPTYIKTMPRRDGWGTDYEFRCPPSGQEYFIRSYGANRTHDETPNGATTDPNADIVFTNGSFSAYPASALKTESR
ncbi:MAG TPA: type II secretion system protein GspG [Thermoanaerobaculia bacterium]|nr:type II secretion system protein GspG [Thermoanaerobaculia bacterium]